MFATDAELNMELRSESLEKGEGIILRINVFKKNKTIYSKMTF
jgi:hypothetical protein